jgi:hypothetical protein
MALWRSGRLDDLEVEFDLHDIAQHRAEGAEAEAEVLATDLTGGLEPGVAGDRYDIVGRCSTSRSSAERRCASRSVLPVSIDASATVAVTPQEKGRWSSWKRSSCSDASRGRPG